MLPRRAPRRRLAALALLLHLAANGATAEPAPAALPIDESPRVRAAADAYLAAWVAGDRDRRSALAAEPTPDPMLVAHSLLERHRTTLLTARAADPVPRTAWLEAARAFADDAGDRPAALGVGRYVTLYATFSVADLQREQRLADAVHAALRTEAARGDPRPALDGLAARRDDVAAGRATVRAWYVRFEEGVLLGVLGRYEEARERYRDAVRLADALPRPRGATLALAGVADMALRLGDLGEAIDAQRRGLASFRATGRTADAALVAADLAASLRRAGLPEEGRRVASDGAQVARGVGDERLVAANELAEARCALALGDAAEGERLATAAATTFSRLALPRDVAVAWGALGEVAFAADRLGDAQRHFERALEAVEAGPHADLRASLRSDLGLVARRLGREGEARAQFEAAVREASQARDPALAAAAAQGLATHRFGRGDVGADVEDLFARAAAARRGLGDPLGAVLSHLGVAGCREGRGDRAGADEALSRALAVATAARLPAAVAQAEAGRAEVALARGDVAGALAGFDRALAALGGRALLGLRRAGIEEARARCLRTLGRLDEALLSARAACVGRLDARHGLVGEDAPYLLARTRGAADLAVDLAIAWRAAGGDAARATEAAFDAAEASRALSLLDAVVHRDAWLAARVPAALREAEATTRARLEAAQARRVAAAATEAGDDDTAADAALAAAYDAHVGATDRAAREARALAATVFPRPASLESARAALGPGEAAVVFHLGADRLAAVVVRPTGEGTPTLVDLGPASDAAEAADAYRRVASTAGADDRRAAAALHARLVAPLRAHCLGATRLLVAADGALAALPFAALLDAGATPARRLVEDVEIALVPSLTVLRALRTSSPAAAVPREVLAVGDPRYPAGGPDALSPLPASRGEAERVAAAWPAAGRRLLLGAAADEAAVRSALPAPRAVVHLACHAFSDAAHPRLSHLALADGGALDVGEVEATRVGADLVVLSACSTGRGEVLAGEGVVGLARAFLLAGARRVVASCAAVEDGASTPLLVDLHAGVAAGLAPSAALAVAQRRALAAGGAAAHPSRWAVFVLVGEP